MVTVSAIITTHNRLYLLKRAIDSVLNQTYTNLECIVVDDASTDGTKEYCEKCESIRFIHIPKEESRGGNYARNIGIKASQGEYCAFLDDDDAWFPEKIEKQMAVMLANDVELVHCGKTYELVMGDKIEYKDVIPCEKYFGDMRRKIMYTIPCTTTNMLVKKNAIEKVGLFDEELRFWQEYELSIRLAQRKPFGCVCEPLSLYRVDINDKNRLTNKYYEWKKTVIYIREKHQYLYNQLTLKERIAYRKLILFDAMHRCRSSRLYIRWFFFQVISIPFRLYSKIIR